MIRAEGVQFTDHMQAALRRCLHVLLDKPGATLRDLVNFMNDGENDRLIDFALTRWYDPDSVSYFRTKFKAREAQIAQNENHCMQGFPTQSSAARSPPSPAGDTDHRL